MGDAWVWLMSAVIITVSLVISTVTLLVIARLRDLGEIPEPPMVGSSGLCQISP